MPGFIRICLNFKSTQAVTLNGNIGTHLSMDKYKSQCEWCIHFASSGSKKEACTILKLFKNNLGPVA